MALPTTSNFHVDIPEAEFDQEIIRNHPWTVYTFAATSQQEALELALLVEVAKSSTKSPGDHGLAVNQKLCSDLLRNNQEFKGIFLRCWEMGSFQDLRSNGMLNS